MILAGDIGGTHSRLAFFDVVAGKLKLVSSTFYPSHDYPGLEQIVVKFLAGCSTLPQVACFGIAGPVRDGRVATPNLPWVVQASQLSAETKIPKVLLINDLQANAMGIAVLEPQDVVPLNQAKGSTPGNIAVIAAGTGLGEAGMYWDGVDHHVFASEGGHCDFAPRTEVEIDLLRYLHGRFGHVSYERVVSGPGLVNIYQFLRDANHVAEPEWLTNEMAQGDPAAAISRAAAAGKWAMCEQAVDLFISIYAAEAGNLALKVMATGGVFLGGGIAPKMVSKLAGPLFMHAFTGKGRMQPLLESIPVKVIVNENTALLGSARTAALAAGLLKPLPDTRAQSAG